MAGTLKTSKGSVLPLLTLKGKDYLQVAHRLQWLSDDYESYTIITELPVLTDEQTVARSTVTLFDKAGKVVRSATGTKRETKKDFADHTEKAETGSIGRALAMLGLGTQHALADLDEGERIVDSPVTNPKTATVTVTTAVNPPATVDAPAAVSPAAAGSNGKKPSPYKRAATAKASVSSDWE